MTIAREWRATIAPGQIDHYEAFARDVSLPMFRQQDGFEGVVMMRSGDQCQVLTLWRDKEAVDRLERSTTYQLTVRKITESGLLCGPQNVSIYEVHLADLQAAIGRGWSNANVPLSTHSGH